MEKDFVSNSGDKICSDIIGVLLVSVKDFDGFQNVFLS